VVVIDGRPTLGMINFEMLIAIAIAPIVIITANTGG
jgi:hypothetical protein